MNILNLTGVIDNPYTEQFSYDQCFISWINQQANVSKSFLNPKEETNFTSGLEKVVGLEFYLVTGMIVKFKHKYINQLN